jgi:UDP-N-acetylmuramoyl-tripeptide--D-alanyl-D-alanine ligase
VWTLEQISRAVAGQCDQTDAQALARTVTGVSIDTRHLTSGDVFFALVGPHHDGHAYVEQAQSLGARAIVANRPVKADVPVITVDDVRLALQALARWHRQQMPLRALIGVTGSNGKTTTKAMLAHCLSQRFSVCATQGNYNNDLGVPLTLLRIRPEHDYAVVEMGANHAHEIGQLCEIARPDCGIVTLATGAHLEGFGSIETIVRTKGELLEALPQGGYGVINCNSEGFEYWQQVCRQKGVDCITFGQSRQASLQLLALSQEERGLAFDLGYDQAGQAVVRTLHLPMLGQHNAWNALACTAVCLKEGMEWDTISDALAEFEGVDQRMQVLDLAQGKLINDVYNANPSSVKAAIETLAALKQSRRGSRALACLGPMSELGDSAEAAHLEVAEALIAADIDQVFLYGEGTRPMLARLGKRAQWFDDHAALTESAHQLLAAETCQHVLVKGSRSAQMENVSRPLIERWALSSKPQSGSNASC